MAAHRFDRLDALRGAAVVWMVAFHFAFDLNHFRFIRQNFYHDPFWTWQRTCIVSTFLFCAGLGQAVAYTQGQRWPRFWRRWAQVAGCALLVTAGSWFIFPKSFITFGVLHGIAVMLVVVRLTAPAGRVLWLMGLVAVLLPQFIQHPLFDGRALNWLGLVTRKPVTEDYVPVLPWLGIMWWGMAAGQWMLARRPHWLSGPVVSPARGLAVIGRWSLTVYMLHQPFFFAILAGVVALKRALV
ncbi:DUF1624 domain-containing protein [Rhizobacter sp. Root1221]|uniref:DUF1624 domain-containing protein n=1 Tax=Rhizobacter sp. Root1221 TaxID=1736433 RepID=UPI0006F46E0A|nr:heparan-alpha-glucosaminide N-acetyltransferase [Rhizobacter sp. Root1221]KQW00378.1 hypothetical protein ASC87_17625 [Rhizobacter sp. Root1221]